MFSTNGISDSPNLLIHLVDDWGWDSWPGHGASASSGASARAMLPAVENLFVRGGLQLQRHYSARICGPARRALLSGRTLAQVGVHNTDCPGVPLRFELLPATLRRGGYRTHFVGKWHAGFYSASLLPSRRGFDTALGFYRGGTVHSQHCAMAKNKCRTYDGAELYDLFETDGDGVERQLGRAYWGTGAETHATSLYAAQLEALIAAHGAEHGAARPLFILASWSAPHKPFEAQSDDEVQAAVAARGAAWYSQCGWLAEMYGAGHGLSCDQDELEANADAAKGRFLARKHYEAMIVGLDRAFARANASLAAAGLWERTLQIFISDNGGRLSEAQTNFPLQGGKFSNLEGGVRTLGAVGGGYLPASLRGRSSHAVMHISDWLPTLAAAAGVATASAVGGASSAGGGAVVGMGGVDGVSAWPAWRALPAC